jgi:uncharacterized protein (DUF4415 family)
MNEKEKYIKSDLAKLDAMSDDDIDYSEIPDLGDKGEEFWDKAIVRGPKQNILIDSDVIDWFKSQNDGYQEHINALLRAYMQAHNKASDQKAA